MTAPPRASCFAAAACERIPDARHALQNQRRVHAPQLSRRAVQGPGLLQPERGEGKGVRLLLSNCFCRFWLGPVGVHLCSWVLRDDNSDTRPVVSLLVLAPVLMTVVVIDAAERAPGVAGIGTINSVTRDDGTMIHIWCRPHLSQLHNELCGRRHYPGLTSLSSSSSSP